MRIFRKGQTMPQRLFISAMVFGLIIAVGATNNAQGYGPGVRISTGPRGYNNGYNNGYGQGSYGGYGQGYNTNGPGFIGGYGSGHGSYGYSGYKNGPYGYENAGYYEHFAPNRIASPGEGTPLRVFGTEQNARKCSARMSHVFSGSRQHFFFQQESDSSNRHGTITRRATGVFIVLKTCSVAYATGE
jgi:hypothetical protein